MNQKNYFFLMCCVTMVNILFAIEKKTLISYGQNKCSLSSFSVLFNKAYQDLQFPIRSNNAESVDFAIDFFSSFTKEDGAREDLRPFLQSRQSPLFFIIEEIASLDQEAAQPVVDLNSSSEYIQRLIILNLKSEKFETLKLLCASCPIFFSDAWRVEKTTPLIHACSRPFPMEKEVQLLLVNNADPCQEITEKKVQYKTALEAAITLNHQSIVALLQSFNKKEML